jgi:ectoine hydroxylase-related dioxygenase (phytanoyl-CoA dioxygenase family)
MDCVLLWRPWWVDSKWKPSTEGLHLDQNPFNKPGLECIQGMVPLLPVTDASGGLQVVPDSNLEAAKVALKRAHPHLRNSGDWCPCDDYELQQKAILLHAEPGDLILWDGRTVHGGLVGTGKCDDTTELARLSVTVNMTPRSWASDLVLQRRQQGFKKGENFNHVPHESGTSNGTVRAPIRRDFRPPQLTDAQLALL